MNNKEFKKNNPFENDMKKRFNSDTEFGREFVNPLDELEMTLEYTNNSADKNINQNKKNNPKK